MMLQDDIACALYANIDKTRKLIEDKQKEVDSHSHDWQSLSSRLMVLKTDRDRAWRTGNYKEFFKLVFAIRELQQQTERSRRMTETLMTETENLISEHKTYAKGLLKYLFDHVPKHSEECQQLVFLNRALVNV